MSAHRVVWTWVEGYHCQCGFAVEGNRAAPLARAALQEHVISDGKRWVDD